MWKCPICGREFKNTEQSHYCSVKPKTIDEYISLQEDVKKSRSLSYQGGIKRGSAGSGRAHLMEYADVLEEA